MPVGERVVDADVARVGHVADGGVEGVGRDERVGEVGVDDARVGVEQSADGGARGVQLYAPHVRLHAFGPCGQEVAGAATRFKDVRVGAADAVVAQCDPHGIDDGGGRVEGGERAATRLHILVLVQPFMQLTVDIGPCGLVAERVRAAAPTRVGAQRVQLGDGGLPAVFSDIS